MLTKEELIREIVIDLENSPEECEDVRDLYDGWMSSQETIRQALEYLNKERG